MKKTLGNMSSKNNYSIIEYYIDSFLYSNRKSIVGKCLLIVNDVSIAVLKKNITEFDLVTINPAQNLKLADRIISMNKIKNDIYDTVLTVNALNCIGDYDEIIKESLRVLKPGGVFLATLLSIAPSKNTSYGVWGFTAASARYIFHKYFTQKDSLIKGYGNVLAGRFLLDERPAHNLLAKQLDQYDPYFPLLIGVKAVKKEIKNKSSK